MDDAEKIERVLQVMRELKSLEKRIRDFESEFPETFAYMLAFSSTSTSACLIANLLSAMSL